MGNCCSGEEDLSQRRGGTTAIREYESHKVWCEARVRDLEESLRVENERNGNLQNLVRYYKTQISLCDRRIQDLQNNLKIQTNTNMHQQNLIQRYKMGQGQQTIAITSKISSDERKKQLLEIQNQGHCQTQTKKLRQDLKKANDEILVLRKRLREYQGPSKLVLKYTDTEKLVAYTKLLENILEEWFDASREEQKGIGMCVCACVNTPCIIVGVHII